MILQALNDLYDRVELAPEGWEYKPIPFLIEISESGEFVELTDLRGASKKPADAKPMLVPKAEIRSGPRAHEKPNTLWDHYGFVFGAPKSDSDKDRTTAALQLEHFVRRVISLGEAAPSSRGLAAVRQFYEKGEFRKAQSHTLWPECHKIRGCNFTFRVQPDTEPILHEPAVREALSQRSEPGDGTQSTWQVCLVTGERSAIQSLHFPISGVCEKPAPLSAVNDGASPSFSSFHKNQGFNFPVGERAVFRYTTALNHLLRRDSRNRFRIGETVCVFWAQRPDEVEDVFAAVFGGDDALAAGQVHAILASVQTGRFDGARGENRFFVLGLAPNAARIAVRFWHAAPLHEIAQRIRAWFADLEVSRGPNDPEYPSLFRLLTAVAVLNKADNIPPNLGGDVMRSILAGTPFPATWLNAAVQRCRAEQRVTYLRAAAVKACLNRSIRNARRIGQEPEKEMMSMLDTTNPSAAYRLGRLFAVLEKVQEEASPGLNATIRERYYGAASSTPVAVFTTLLRLKNHHLAKLDNRGRAVNLEKLIGEIVDGIGDFPAHLALPDQGRFALGYYHQRQAFFTKNTDD